MSFPPYSQHQAQGSASSYNPSYNNEQIQPGMPIGQPLPSLHSPPSVNMSSHPGGSYAPTYGPPPPVPGNRPDGHRVQHFPPAQPQPYEPSYLASAQQHYQPAYPPPLGPPPHGYAAPHNTSYTQPSMPYAPAYPQPPVPYPGAPQHAPNQPWYLGVPVPDPFIPSSTVQPLPGYSPGPDFEAVRGAAKGFGTNDKLLIETINNLSIAQRDALAHYFLAKTGKTLLSVVDSETSGYFRMGLKGLIMGPLLWDAELVRSAVSGAGTSEEILTEVLLCRSSAELALLISAYRHVYGRDLVQDVCGDLSVKTKRMFQMALTTNTPPDSTPVDKAQVARDVDALYKAGQGRVGTDEMVFCDVLINRSHPHITEVIGEYSYKHKSLKKIIKKEFSGHMRDGLLHIVDGLKPKRDMQGIWRDAKLIDKAMVGLGTKDKQLVWRLLRAQWDPKHMEAIREAYKLRTGKLLEARVASETSGSYKNLMVLLVNRK